MSGHSAGPGLVYPLGLPRRVLYSARLIGSGVIVCGLMLEVSDSAIALVLLVTWRSWRQSGHLIQGYSGAILCCKRSGRIDILSFDDIDYFGLAWDRLVRFPGFMAVRFCRNDGKPLEILIFCRYDLRRSYRRLVLHLIYRQD